MLVSLSEQEDKLVFTSSGSESLLGVYDNHKHEMELLLNFYTSVRAYFLSLFNFDRSVQETFLSRIRQGYFVQQSFWNTNSSDSGIHHLVSVTVIPYGGAGHKPC